ncbi:hypothetical protein [Marinomonas sp. 2405UD68-3]|uniref:hypothetical protein n=1 Tax=Marinomonas sp. 2405UD68-3 TaxID=3391835 RepID=UPI0039C98047
MSKGSRISFVLYFIAFVLPVLGVMNCDGWNTASMSVKSCAIDSGVLRGYADLYTALFYFSSFLVFIPILIYIGVCTLIIKLIRKIIGNNKHAKKIK